MSNMSGYWMILCQNILDFELPIEFKVFLSCCYLQTCHLTLILLPEMQRTSSSTSWPNWTMQLQSMPKLTAWRDFQQIWWQMAEAATPKGLCKLQTNKVLMQQLPWLNHLILTAPRLIIQTRYLQFYFF